MVQEYRKITLSTDELISALEIYRRILPDFLPPGRIVHCAVFEYGVIKVTLESRDGEKDRRSYVTLRAIDVLKPVIGFCIQNNIPLPREGRKSVEIQRGSVALRVDLTLQTQLPGQPSAKENGTPPPAEAMAAEAHG